MTQHLVKNPRRIISCEEHDILGPGKKAEKSYAVVEYDDGITVYTPNHSELCYRTGRFLENPRSYLMNLLVEQNRYLANLAINATIASNAESLQALFDYESDLEEMRRCDPLFAKFYVFSKDVKNILRTGKSVKRLFAETLHSEEHNRNTYKKIAEAFQTGRESLASQFDSAKDDTDLECAIGECRRQLNTIIHGHHRFAGDSEKHMSLINRLIVLHYPNQHL